MLPSRGPRTLLLSKAPSILIGSCWCLTGCYIFWMLHLKGATRGRGGRVARTSFIFHFCLGMVLQCLLFYSDVFFLKALDLHLEMGQNWLLSKALKVQQGREEVLGGHGKQAQVMEKVLELSLGDWRGWIPSFPLAVTLAFCSVPGSWDDWYCASMLWLVLPDGLTLASPLIGIQLLIILAMSRLCCHH